MMAETGFTTINLKKINKSKVYHYIYERKTASKLQIVQDLQMGLSTVSQNLTLLEEEGLIERSGFFDSTGGRKAHVIRIVPDFRISIGIGLLKDMFHIVAVDLNGDVMRTETFSVSYVNTPSYYEQVAEKIEKFIVENQYEKEKILGISFATQGIISPDHTMVTYGKIMDNTNMQIQDFAKHLNFPCHLEHDSKAAACLELWKHREIDSAVVFLLNRNFGGAIITNRRIHQGTFMHSGTIEHMCINPDGPLCYCGNRGCLETYCSANALERSTGLKIKEFFPAMRKGDAPQLTQIWQDYLKHLAFSMKNLNMVIDASMIISGYLAPYFTEEDIAYLVGSINAASPFGIKREQIFVGSYGQYTPAIGAALFYVEQFIQSV